MNRAPTLLTLAATLALLSCMVSCGKKAMVTQGTADSRCGLVFVGDEATTINVAVSDVVEPQYAPWPHNPSEQLLFAHLYETLITIDCDNHARPGLAMSWLRENKGRRWLFELNENKRFWDGARVRAADVIASWKDPLTLTSAIDSVTRVDDRRLRVYLAKPTDTVPRVLSSPAFAVAKRTAEHVWPSGTGPYMARVDSEQQRGTVTIEPAFNKKGPTILFYRPTRTDMRDVLDGAADVVMTTDPVVFSYAMNSEQFSATPLPWDKTYVLLFTRWPDHPIGMSKSFTDRLAKDAVKGDARTCEEPLWWSDLQQCGDFDANIRQRFRESTGVLSGNVGPSVLFDAKDPIARSLAERIVALASTDPQTSLEAATVVSVFTAYGENPTKINSEGQSAREFAASLKHGDRAAYVISLPRQPSDSCYETQQLINRAPWLSKLVNDIGGAVIPLVDTRAYVITRNESMRVQIGNAGGITIANGNDER